MSSIFIIARLVLVILLCLRVDENDKNAYEERANGSWCVFA